MSTMNISDDNRQRQTNLRNLPHGLLSVVTDSLVAEHSIATAEELIAGIACGLKRPDKIPEKSWECLVESARNALPPKILRRLEKPRNLPPLPGTIDELKAAKLPAAGKALQAKVQVLSSKKCRDKEGGA